MYSKSSIINHCIFIFENLKLTHANTNFLSSQDTTVLFVCPQRKLKKIYHFIDTPGTQDTDDKKTDEQILNEIQRRLHKTDAEYIQILCLDCQVIYLCFIQIEFESVECS